MKIINSYQTLSTFFVPVNYLREPKPWPVRVIMGILKEGLKTMGHRSTQIIMYGVSK